MAELADAITVAMTDRDPAVSEESSLSEILSALVDAAGSGNAAAALLGISGTTFYRWRNYADQSEKGIRQAPKQGRRTMVAALRSLDVQPARRRAVKQGDLKMVIRATVSISNDRGRTRNLNVGDNVTAHRMGYVIRSWEAGNDDNAERLLLKAIDEDYAPGLEIDSVEYVEFR
jgi:hypothetical protein